MNVWLMVTLVFIIDILLRSMLQFGAWTPDLILLALAYITLTHPLGLAYTMSFLFGLAWDGAFYDTMGLHALLFTLAAMMIARLKNILWAQYAISRFAIGFLACGFVRFGEVMYWLSNMDHQVPFEIARNYVLLGALVTGTAFYFVVWKPKPLRIPQRTPQVIFSER